MPTNASRLGEELEKSLGRLFNTSQKALILHQDGQLGTRSLDDVIGGLAVLAYAEIEGFLERLFTGLLVGSLVPSNRRRVKPLIKAKSYAHARAIILGHSEPSDFVTWLPYSNTKKHAQRLFRSGRPFVNLDESTETAIHHLHHLRNALAHGSTESLERFRKHCIRGRTLPLEQRRPAGYLRGLHTGSSTRLEHLLNECRVGLSALSSS